MEKRAGLRGTINTPAGNSTAVSDAGSESQGRYLELLLHLTDECAAQPRGLSAPPPTSHPTKPGRISALGTAARSLWPVARQLWEATSELQALLRLPRRAPGCRHVPRGPQLGAIHYRQPHAHAYYTGCPNLAQRSPPLSTLRKPLFA